MNPTKSAFTAICLSLGTLPSFAQWTLEPLFTLAPGDRSYLPATGDNNQRGLGYNPATGHLLLTDRAGGTFVHVLDGTTGADLGTLNTTGITGGTFGINMLRVADDGAIYAANLTTDSSAASPGPVKIYRWANETAAPQLVYQGDPSAADASATNRRFGDNFDVRGSGTGTQLLMGSRNGTVAGLFTTSDGINFSSTKLTNPDATTAAGMGVAVSFGNGNNFFGDASGSVNPRQFGYDLGTGVLTTVATYTAPNVAIIGVDPANNLLAGIALNATPTKDTLVLYDISSGSAVQQDVKSFPLDQANANGVGAVEFANGTLYALDVNNGIVAYKVVPEPGTVALGMFGAAALVFAARRRR